MNISPVAGSSLAVEAQRLFSGANMELERPHRLVNHPYAWLWEPLESEGSFLLRAMFGAKAVYLDGKLALCFIAKAEPWRGVLVCTDKLHHDSLLNEFPALAPHSVLPKWLYLSEDADHFDRDAAQLVELVRKRDARIGVVGEPKKAKGRRRKKT